MIRINMAVNDDAPVNKQKWKPHKKQHCTRLDAVHSAQNESKMLALG